VLNDTKNVTYILDQDSSDGDDGVYVLFGVARQVDATHEVKVL
jgi:hypothetical protein